MEYLAPRAPTKYHNTVSSGIQSNILDNAHRNEKIIFILVLQ